jgi:hypothetical protein
MDALQAALSKPSRMGTALALAGWSVVVALATLAAFKAGSSFTRIDALGLPRPPRLTILAALGYWVVFTLLRWWWIGRKRRP